MILGYAKTLLYLLLHTMLMPPKNAIKLKYSSTAKD